jgi:hypothetical protein
MGSWTSKRASFERPRGGFGAAFALFSPASLIRQHHVSLRSYCHLRSIRRLLPTPGWPCTPREPCASRARSEAGWRQDDDGTSRDSFGAAREGVGGISEQGGTVRIGQGRSGRQQMSTGSCAVGTRSS